MSARPGPKAEKVRLGCTRCSPRLEGLADGAASRRRSATCRGAESSSVSPPGIGLAKWCPRSTGVPGPQPLHSLEGLDPRPFLANRAWRGREKGRDPDSPLARADHGLAANLDRASRTSTTDWPRRVVRGDPRTVGIRNSESDHEGVCGRWAKTGAKGEPKIRNGAVRSLRSRSGGTRPEACAKPS